MSNVCVGIDLGGTFIKFCLLDESRRASGIFQLPAPLEKGPGGVIDEMVAGGLRILEENNVSRADVLGVGIGSPGPLDIAAGVILGAPNLPGFKDIPVQELLAKGMDMPAKLENDANAAALGEYLCGVGRGVTDMVLLTLGTGVGSGIILGGRILHGRHSIGGEIGHMIVEPAGEKCGCGQSGCLERYCSATYTAQYARRLIEQKGRDSSLKAVLASTGDIDMRDINEARKAGDELAAEVWDRMAYYLAIGCISICRVFDPDLIILAGGLTKAGSDLMAPVRKHFRRMNWELVEPLTKIVRAALGSDAGVIGAAGVAWQAFGPNGQAGAAN